MDPTGPLFLWTELRKVVQGRLVKILMLGMDLLVKHQTAKIYATG
jgi:hypothetical protein